MTSPQVIFVRLPDTIMGEMRRVGAVQHPLGLVYLATWLRQCGYACEIIDLEIEPFSCLEHRLRQCRPLLVGMTVITPAMPQARTVCSLCRSLGVKTVLGGPHPTALPAETLAYTACDYVVMGEGERALSALLGSMTDNKPANGIDGLAFFDGGSAVINKRAPLVSLSEFPIPDRSMLRLDRYKGEATPGVPGRGTTMFTSRGCTGRCTFCASRVIDRQQIRFRDMEAIRGEIDAIAGLGFDHIVINDELFTADASRVREFCAYLMSVHSGLSWSCDSRVDTIDESLLALMKKANCRKIAFGVESGSPRILETIGKDIGTAQVREAFRMSRDSGLLTQGYFMIGFPDETPQDVAATERLIFEVDPDFLALSVAVPYPGTELFERMRRNNFLDSEDWGSFVFFGKDIPWRTRYFAGSDLARIRRRISRRFYLRPAYVAKSTRRLRSMRDAGYLMRGAWTACKLFLG